MPKTLKSYRSNKPIIVTKYCKIQIPEHPLAHKDGQVYIHRAVLFDKIGPGTHLCHWCNKPITWGNTVNDLLVDHINGKKHDNSPDNLVPSCNKCNIGRIKKEQTHCKNGHEFSPENTYIRKGGFRVCRICRNKLSTIAHKKNKNGKI